MSAASLEYMMKTVLKLIGVTPESLNPTVLIPQLLNSQGIAPEQAQEAFAKAQRLMLDYEQNQAHLNMRITAILKHFEIVDPVENINQIEDENGRD